MKVTSNIEFLVIYQNNLNKNQTFLIKLLKVRSYRNLNNLYYYDDLEGLYLENQGDNFRSWRKISKKNTSTRYSFFANTDSACYTDWNVSNGEWEIIGEDIEFEFNTHADSAHYEITPYDFSPKLGQKYSPELHRAS